MGFSVWMYGLSRPKSKFLPLSRHFCITSWFDDDVTRITSILLTLCGLRSYQQYSRRLLSISLHSFYASIVTSLTSPCNVFSPLEVTSTSCCCLLLFKVNPNSASVIVPGARKKSAHFSKNDHLEYRPCKVFA